MKEMIIKRDEWKQKVKDIKIQSIDTNGNAIQEVIKKSITTGTKKIT